MARSGFGLPLLLLVSIFLAAQNPVSTTTQGATLAAQSIAAMTAGTAVTDVTINGNATWFAGSDTETATMTLLGKGTTESKVSITLTSGSRIETRNAANGFPQGQWVNPNGTSGAYAWHNCETDAVWFFPVLSSLANFANSSFVFSYVGQETWNGATAQHVRVYKVAPGSTSPIASLAQTLSTMDFYLDPTSSLPLAIDFNAHPDNDTITNLRVEVRFTNYQAVNGVQMPFHTQQWINGVLALDLAVTNATLNSGLTDNQFSIQ